MASRLALGTAQFGLPYGISNRGGQVGRNEAASILRCAREAGIDTLDTAIDYGESEARLGEIGVEGWQVISKVPAVPDECTDIDAWMRRRVTASLARLGVPRLAGVLLHRPMQLAGDRGDEIYAALLACQARGEAGKIGVSIYGPEELDAIVTRYKIGIVQGPFNVVDRRLAASGWMRRLRGAGIELHVRSVFLQGLLLMAGPERPARFDRWRGLWESWQGWLDSQKIGALQACLGYAMAQPEIDRVVVGVESMAQLCEVLASSAVDARPVPDGVASEDADLINPSRWAVQ